MQASLRRAVQATVGLSRSSGTYHLPHKQPTMDVLHSPAGSFAELNAKRQAKNTRMLIGGTVFMLVSFGYAYSTGTLKLYGPPKVVSEGFRTS